jgi:hypothetical protein
MKRLFALAILSVALASFAFACTNNDPICPVHNLDMTFTGQTKAVNGNLFGLFRCPDGDVYWIRCD